MPKLKTFFLKFFNLSPFFSISSDDLFGSIELNYRKRYSLVRISFGLIKIYLVSYENRTFNFIKTINLNKIRPWPLIDIVKEKLNAYKELSKDKTDSELKIHTRYLDKKIEIESNAKALFQNKVSTYSAILLVIAGYVVYLFDETITTWDSGTQPFIVIFILFFVILNYLNCIIFIYYFSKNKPISRSTFLDIKNNATLKELSFSLYFDWYNLKEERDVLSTYVKNIEKYLVKTVLLVFILSLMQTMSFVIIPEKSIPHSKKIGEMKSITLIDEKGVFNNVGLKELPRLLHNMLSRDVKTVYIIKNKINKNKLKYKQVLNTLNLFSNNTDFKTINISGYSTSKDILIITPAK